MQSKIYVQYVPPASASANLLPKENSNKAGPDDWKMVASSQRNTQSTKDGNIDPFVSGSSQKIHRATSSTP